MNYYYYDIKCIMLEMAWITLQCTERLWSASLCKAKNTSAGDRLDGSRPLTLPTATDGVELICQLWLIWFLPLFWTLSPEATNQSVWMFLCSPVTPKYWIETFWPMRRWQRTWTSAQTAWPAGGGAAVPSQLVCTILYSPSPCVSPPLSSIAMEKPCWCMYWHLYKCTSLKKKMKPWHIWNKWVTCVFIWISPLKNTNAAFKMFALCSCDIFSSIDLV